MAALAVSAELKLRDGLSEKVSVKAENNLSSLVNAIHEVNENVSRLLSELVEREKPHGDCAAGAEEDSDEEDEEPEDPVNSEQRPPAKRPKT